jgi:hypothetical protein
MYSAAFAGDNINKPRDMAVRIDEANLFIKRSDAFMVKINHDTIVPLQRAYFPLSRMMVPAD